MDDLRARLETALAGHYTFDRELGGGGMSRTYLVREVALNRRVVLKVLAPELLAGISVERFRREILLAAQLQHPHVVPVLTAGDTSGVPWFTMPFVDGDSLRRRLDQGPLPMTEVVSVLRDVARALTYAHAHGIVHRDIKPDNVLLSSGTATVTDFGIAKAISAARTGGGDGNATLTQAGMSIGTPAYMSPEQALGDTDTDHRADLYSFGAMAFELIAGRAPFQAGSPAKMLAAHINDTPADLLAIRPDCPPALAALVQQCLAKSPEDRPGGARELTRVLDSITTSGSGTATPAILQGGRIRLGRAIGLWAAATAVVWLTAWAATSVVGLPGWVLPGSVAVMLAGLPVIGFTWFAQGATHRAFTATPGRHGAPGPIATLAIKASPHLSWRRAWLGGGIAVGSFAVLVIGFMVLRAFGIGPMGSLRGSGAFSEHETILVADFASPADDAALGSTVAEALRTDLAQSTNLRVFSRNTMGQLLNLMKRPADTTVGFDLAREIATREGAKAVLDGAIKRLGTSYLITARLVGVLDGRELALFREEASDQSELLAATGRLSRAVRSKAGESLRTVQSSLELERVTTPSLEALRKYVEATRLSDQVGDLEGALARLRKAVALDTGFAMAWRKLAAVMLGAGYGRAATDSAISAAYRHRERLTESERHLTEGYYWYYGPTPDRAKALAAYEAAIALDSSSMNALSNAANIHAELGNYRRTDELYRLAERSPTPFAPLYTNMMVNQIRSGQRSALDSTARRFHQRFPGHPIGWRTDFLVAWGNGRVAVAESITAANARTLSVANFGAALHLAGLLEFQGRPAAARVAMIRVDSLVAATDPSPGNHALLPVDSAYYEGQYGDRRTGHALLTRALATFPLPTIPNGDAAWNSLLTAAIAVGDPGLMRRISDAASVRWAPFTTDSIGSHAYLRGTTAFVEGRWLDAVRELAEAQRRVAATQKELMALRGIAFAGAGQTDSAVAILERYRATPEGFVDVDARWNVPVLESLGELYEVTGKPKLAIERYGEITELWAKAEPSLQPKVKEIRQKITRLMGSTG